MKQVSVYIETSSTVFRRHKRVCAYVLEYITASGVTVTREAFRIGEGTYHQEFLQTLAEALARIKEPCSICVRGEDGFVLTMIDEKLREWADHEFMSNGKPVANQEEWKKLWEVLKVHEVSTETGKHAYSDWMLKEMEERNVFKTE